MMSVKDDQTTRISTSGKQDADLKVRIASAALSVALVILLASLLWKDADSAEMSSQLFAYPFQFDESEGMIVAETMLLDKGVNIYNKPSPDLFIAAPYPPVFYLLAWPIQHLIGSEPTFKIGRALSILATVLAGLCLFGIVSALARDKLAGAIAAAVWWSLGLVAFWGSLVKPDMPGLALGLGGLWWLVARPPRQVLWSLPFFLAAFYTKQTAIAAGVAAVVWVLATRPRTGVIFGAAYLGGALLPAIALNWLTNGGYLYHMITIHSLPWFPDRFVQFAQGFLLAYGYFLVLGMLAILALAVAWLVSRRSGRDADYSENAATQSNGMLLAVLYFLMSLVVAVGAGTLGGNHNHFLEWAAASSLGFGLGVGLVRRLRWQWQFMGAAAALVLAAQVPSLFQTPHWIGRELRVPPDSVTEGMTNVFKYVTNNGGPAYSDNTGLMLLTHKRLWSTDPYTQTHATFYGRWDESKLVDEIKRKGFAQIILRIDVFSNDAGAGDVSPGILQAVRDNYKLDQRNVENIYVPN